MGLETGTYISDLNTSNPSGTDAKSQGDDHLRLIKATVKATFPNISGAVTPTHTELNYVDGVTSAIQTQIDTKGAHAGQTWTGAHDFTGGTIIVPTASGGDADTSAASTAFVDSWFAKKASPTLTGTPVAPTAAPGTNTTQIATTAFVIQQAFQAALPVQTGEVGKFLQTDGTNAAWVDIANLKNAKSADYTLLATDRYKHLVLTGSFTLSLIAAATAGDGFVLYVRNDGAGRWLIDPNGAETIDGRSSIYLYPGEAFAVICDGSGWRTFGRSRGPILISSTTVSVSVASVDCETGFDDTEFTRFQVVGEGLVSASGRPGLQFKKSGAYAATNYVTKDSANTAIDGANTDQVALIGSNTLTFDVVADVYHYSSTVAQEARAVFSAVAPVSPVLVMGTGTQSTAAAVTGVRVRNSGGNLTAGTVRHYGFR